MVGGLLRFVLLIIAARSSCSTTQQRVNRALGCNQHILQLAPRVVLLIDKPRHASNVHWGALATKMRLACRVVLLIDSHRHGSIVHWGALTTKIRLARRAVLVIDSLR